ncbi:MAG: hypothetical protein QXI92_03710 [Candidatus Nitrosocaldus sp.]
MSNITKDDINRFLQLLKEYVRNIGNREYSDDELNTIHKELIALRGKLFRK